MRAFHAISADTKLEQNGLDAVFFFHRGGEISNDCDVRPSLHINLTQLSLGEGYSNKLEPFFIVDIML